MGSFFFLLFSLQKITGHEECVAFCCFISLFLFLFQEFKNQKFKCNKFCSTLFSKNYLIPDFFPSSKQSLKKAKQK